MPWIRTKPGARSPVSVDVSIAGALAAGNAVGVGSRIVAGAVAVAIAVAVASGVALGSTTTTIIGAEAATTSPAGVVAVTVSRPAPAARLVAYLDKDTGLPADGREVKLSEGRAVVDVDQLFGRRGKLILKLLRGSYLADEAIVAL